MATNPDLDDTPGGIAPSTDHLERYLVSDAASTASGVVLGVVLVSLVAATAWWAWTIIVIVTVMGLVRRQALQPLRAGDVRTAVAYIAAGSWGVSLGVVMIAPSFLPVLIITLAIPAVIAAMFLRGRDVAIVAGLLVVITLVCGSLGMWGDGVDLEDKIGESLRNLVVVGYLAGQMVPLVQIVWQTSRLQRASLERAVALNHELTTSQRQLAASRSRLVEAADAERVRIERDLHDGAQQALVSTLLQLRLTARGVERGQVAEAERLDELAAELEQGIDELRTLAHGIFPPLLDARGLFEATRSLAQTGATAVDVVGNDPGRLPPSQEAAFYFCISEALQNVAKHAGPAATATVRFAVTTSDGTRPRELEVTVQDDGDGADPDVVEQGYGMTNQRDRMGAIGGAVTVDIEQRAGCVVRFTAPLSARDAGEMLTEPAIR